MSTTSTTTTRTNSVGNQYRQRAVLADYELHHSRSQQEKPATTASAGNNDASTIALQWDEPHHRVPAYRAANRQRDQSEVRVYTSGIERAFITVMFTGLYINAAAAQTWRASFGRLSDRVFRYPVGGEL
ncbi:hypothetical protein FZEAL_3888 [Fusarium zealandicum]|uniref:Uncharacterized protein n=1 Tax=Fusarium zealandicum TaxID=1053134 RepID=A0A8H4UNL4_9HYPO|nr:hypothetical protein FZEAL_3888 [Fusarium zealandicum]